MVSGGAVVSGGSVVSTGLATTGTVVGAVVSPGVVPQAVSRDRIRRTEMIRLSLLMGMPPFGK